MCIKYLQFCQIDIDDYVPSNEWKLLDHPAEKHVLRYPCCEEPYVDLTYKIIVKRIAVFYSFILVLPCILLSLLTLVSFWLPTDSPAKVLLGRLNLTINSRISRSLTYFGLINWRTWLPRLYHRLIYNSSNNLNNNNNNIIKNNII